METYKEIDKNIGFLTTGKGAYVIKLKRVSVLSSEEVLNIVGACMVVFGSGFAVLNWIFRIFSDVALSNWLIGVIIGLFYCVTNILSNWEEYHNDNFPKAYQIWTVVYPVIFLGSLLLLLYWNFVAQEPLPGLKWGLGLFLALILCLSSCFSDKYDDIQESHAKENKFHTDG